jgi:hypothetical protein
MVDNDSSGYLPCLMCDAEVSVSADDIGQDVYCSYCQISMKLRQDKKEDDLYLEEDDWG